MNGKQFENGYATLDDTDGVNYREIAEIMSLLGHPMNHSSARNHVIRIMQKFAAQICTKWELKRSSEDIEEIARDPRFQSAIAEMLQYVEATRRETL